jgi:HAAS
VKLPVERYVRTVSRRLRTSTDRRRRREIRRELRGHLESAAADVGVATALAGMGAPDRVAREYAEAEGDRPRVWRPVAGAIASLFSLVLVAFLNQRQVRLERAPGWGDFDPWSADLRLLRLNGDLEQTLVVHVWIHRAAYVLVPLAIFVLASRAWRLLGAGGRARRLAV